MGGTILIFLVDGLIVSSSGPRSSETHANSRVKDQKRERDDDNYGITRQTTRAHSCDM